MQFAFCISEERSLLVIETTMLRPPKEESVLSRNVARHRTAAIDESGLIETSNLRTGRGVDDPHPRAADIH